MKIQNFPIYYFIHNDSFISHWKKCHRNCGIKNKDPLIQLYIQKSLHVLNIYGMSFTEKLMDPRKPPSRSVRSKRKIIAKEPISFLKKVAKTN